MIAPVHRIGFQRYFQQIDPGRTETSAFSADPTLEGTRTVIKYVAEQNPKAASVKAEDLIDTTWLDRLDKEGFFDKVYRGK